MEYLLSFLEGIITFISPCMLPMLPIYISYFTGQNNEDKKQKTIYNAVGFVLGFTIFFMVIIATKFLGTVFGSTEKFTVDNEDLFLSLVGFVMFFTIKILNYFNEKETERI